MVQESIYDRLFSQHTESFSAKVRDPLGWESSLLHVVEPETSHPKEKISKPVQSLPPKPIFKPELVSAFESESEREAKPELEPEPIRETGPEPVNLTVLDESEPEDKPAVHGPLSDLTLEPTPVPESDTQSIHVPTSDAILLESEPESQPESILEIEIDTITEPENETDPEVLDESEPEDKPVPDSETETGSAHGPLSDSTLEPTPVPEPDAQSIHVPAHVPAHDAILQSEPEAQPESILETEIDTMNEPNNKSDPEEDATLLLSSTESDHQQSDSPIVAPASLPSDSSHSVESTPETEVVAQLNPARMPFKLFCSSKHDKAATLHELSIHALKLGPAFAAYEAGTQSSQILARDIITALFARDHMEGKHWDYDTATARRPSLAEDVNPNEGEAWYAEKEATWDWKDIYSVATAKGTVRFLPNEEKIQVEQYSFYAAG